MRNIFVTILFFAFTILPLSGQDKKSFGDVNYEDFQNEYADDAVAVVLFDHGKTTFISGDGLDIRFVRETRMKINKKAGFGYAEITIPYYQDGYGKTERIEDIEAYTYNIDAETGLITRYPLSPSDIYEEEINDYWSMKKFVFPDVHEGSVIEYHYEKITPFVFNPPDWEFQYSIPVKESTYEIHLTPFYEYTYLLQGATEFDKQQTYKSSGTDVFAGITYNLMVHQYTMRDIPAFEDESFITSRDDYIMKLDFQLSRINYPTGGSKEIMTSWKLIKEDLLKAENFGKYLKQAEKEAGDYLGSNPDLNDVSGKTEKLERIVRKIRRDFEWDGSTDKYAGDKAKDVFKTRTGNSAELNLILCAVLSEAGFKASPVILSTRNHGKVHPAYPFSHYFNDVICFVEFEGQSVLVDATESWLPYNKLPLRCLNELGLIVEDGEERWASLETADESRAFHSIDLEIDPDQMIAKVKSANHLSGYTAYAARKSIFNDSERLVRSSLSGSLESIDAIEFADVTDPTKPYRVNFEGETELENYDNKIIVQPFLGLVESETPLKAAQRRYPVDMIYRRQQQIISKISLPKGYGVLELPKAVAIEDDLVKIDLSHTVNDDFVEIRGFVYFKSAMFKPAVYARLRDHYLQLITSFNQPVIIEKMAN
ncbi:DUF3857 domain-containing protein [Fulvivirga sedimenti]|uniref:DUF3857 domain-containing protein n=1 Tax=Fulvivirga sedimenti TaxID=2879465 RepID=A0A9X1L2I3_9BACT|nr:DUF3857 domain-containing protein [Fulvivirga sedimenti]MCA6078226.1 DUF3857 domain-containing protein [Fulvivirga sedimenti]